MSESKKCKFPTFCFLFRLFSPIFFLSPFVKFVLNKNIKTRQTNSFDQKPGETKQHTQQLAGFCRTLKLVEFLINLEKKSFSSEYITSFPHLFPRNIAFWLTEQVTSRSAKGHLAHGETWSHGKKSMPSMPINWPFLRLVNGVAGGKALSQMSDQFCRWVAYWKNQ